ncbi:MAG: methyltransferase, partial [Gammaproteobacteria bacterium]|nr:methyltransferase [Gammaproteobacteria bacterium]
MIKSIVPLIVVASFMSSVATAGDFSEKIKQAMQSEHRTEAEQLRDRNRKPVQTLEFFGIKDNMSVIELIPGGGWYTKLLAPALR